MATKYISIRDAKFIYKTNFRGEKGPFNKNGQRKFNVIVPDHLVEELEADGWNVKYTKPKVEGAKVEPYLEVKLGYKDEGMPNETGPIVYQITSNGKTKLTSVTVGNLDFADIEQVHMTINPYYWSKDGESGVAAYLRSIYVTLAEDEFAKEFADIPENGTVAPDTEVPF